MPVPGHLHDRDVRLCGSKGKPSTCTSKTITSLNGLRARGKRLGDNAQPAGGVERVGADLRPHASATSISGEGPIDRPMGFNVRRDHGSVHPPFPLPPTHSELQGNRTGPFLLLL